MVAPGAASSPVWLRGHVDALGRRAVRWTGVHEAVEVLRLADWLTAAPSCASRLADSAFSLRGLDHPALPPAPEVEELPDGTPVLASRHLPGERLAGLIERSGTPLTTSAVLFVLREVVGAVRTLHAAGLCHGAIAPERILVTPDLRVVLLDPALGTLLASSLEEPAARLWADLGVAVPTTPGLPPFSPLTDQLQVGLTGLAMLLGRTLRADEYPDAIAGLIDSAQETDLVGGQSAIGPMLREWLARTVLVSANGPFPSMEAAAGDLDILLSDDGGYVAAPLGLEIEPVPLEPMSADEAAALGLQPVEAHELPAPDTAAAGEWAVGVATDDQVLAGEAMDETAGTAAPADFGGGADVPVVAPPLPPPVAGPPDALAPAPDPTANSERILELAHGLDGSRARREVSADGNVAEAPGKGRQRSGWRAWSSRAAALAAGVVILLMAGVAAGTYYVTSGVTRSAHLVIESTPQGASVVFEGQTLGRTPVEVSLPRGAHVFEVRGQHSSQSLSVVVGGGERRTEHVTLPEAGAPGTLVITTEPVGVSVSVDGVARGSAPLSLQVAPGHHVVSATDAAGEARREVDVQAGGWVQVPLAVSGWIEVVSPVPVHATVSGRAMPDGETRFAVGPGRHRVQLVNDEVGLRDSQDVVVEAGHTTRVTVAGAEGVVEITSNAADASVWIDGSLAGRVPLTATLPPGRHEIRFTHPQRGELRYEVFVKLGNSFLHGDFGPAVSPAPSRAPARRR